MNTDRTATKTAPEGARGTRDIVDQIIAISCEELNSDVNNDYPSKEDLQQVLKDNPTVVELLKINKLEAEIKQFIDAAKTNLKSPMTQTEVCRNHIQAATRRAIKSACDLM